MDVDQLSSQFSSFTPKQIQKVWLSLHSVNRGQVAIQQLVLSLHDYNYDSVISYIFNQNLAELKKQLSPEKVPVAGYFCFSVICNQMTHIAKRFHAEKQYEFFALVALDKFVNSTSSKFSDFIEFPFLAIPDKQDHQYLDFLKAVFLPETIDVYRWCFPESVIRIGCPHGIDISLDTTLHRYGAVLTFDYILSPAYEKNLASCTIIDQYPKELIEHSCPFVCAIPTGFAKLDSFYKRCQIKSSGQHKIIYHLSNWQLESKQARSGVAVTLGCLLDNFPDSQILFRCFPGDLERVELQQQIASFAQHPNLYFSTNSSYIDDYADGDLLVTHRPQTGQNFSLASGRPIFLLDCQDNGAFPKETELGMQLFNHQQLVSHIQLYFQQPSSYSARIDKYRFGLIHNLGQALDYLIENFDYILQQKRHPDWHYLSLHSPTVADLPAKQNILRCLHNKLDKRQQFVHLSEAAVAVYPNDPEICFIAAQSRARTPNPFEHNYFFEFHYIALKHITNALELCDEENSQLLSKIHHWISRKALFMAQGVKWYVNQHSCHYGQDIDRLIERFYQLDSLNKLMSNSQSLFYKKRQEDIFLFSFDDFLTKIDSGITSVYLYGAGAVARDFIYLNDISRRLKIEKIFDSNKSKHGTKLLGIDVCDIQDALISNLPIVICSIAFKWEIELMLKETFSDTVTTITLSRVAGSDL